VDPAHHTGWESCAWEYVILQNEFGVGSTIPILRTQMLLNLHQYSQDQITVYCFFSLGTAVKLEKQKNHPTYLSTSKVCRVELCTELFYAFIPTLFLCFLLICYPNILLHFNVFLFLFM